MGILQETLTRREDLNGWETKACMLLFHGITWSEIDPSRGDQTKIYVIGNLNVAKLGVIVYIYIPKC